jgi:hypothetical protein
MSFKAISKFKIVKKNNIPNKLYNFLKQIQFHQYSHLMKKYLQLRLQKKKLFLMIK